MAVVAAHDPLVRRTAEVFVQVRRLFVGAGGHWVRPTPVIHLMQYAD
jgi:hypothetical protein